MNLRLDRLLSSRGYCSRGAALSFIRSSPVLVNGARPTSSAHKVNPEVVTVADQPIDPGPGMVVLLNKPGNFTCSRDDQGALIYDLLPERFGRRNPPLVSVGRLDRDTTGVLLLTDDGLLNHLLTSPKRKVAKIYEVTVADPLSGEEAQIFQSGTLILDGEEDPLLPAALEQTGERSCRLVLHEGRYHQVKRMFAAIGNAVTALHRSAFGPITVTGLDEGQIRILSGPEVAELRAQVSRR